MTARNYLIAKPFGLKTAEKKAQSGKTPSKNIFPVLFRNENEIVMGANDKHLSFRASVLLAKAGDETDIFLTTVVRFNNFGGRLYFALIKPFHRLIVKSALRKL